MADTFTDTYAAVVAACQAATGTGQALDGVSIADGPITQRGSETKRLFIGTSADNTSGDGDNPESSIPGVIDNDVFSIVCVAEAWGDTLANVRASALGIRAGVRALLRPDPSGITLGVRSLASARLGAWTLEQMQAQSGPYAGVTFRIDCVARPSTS